MRRSRSPGRRPPAALRKVVPCPACGGGGGWCGRFRGERRAAVHEPLRRLSDGELRVHALRLFGAARGIYGHPSVWVRSGGQRPPPDLCDKLALRLSHALGTFDSAAVRHFARWAAQEVLKVGARDAARALCALGRRAARGSYGPIAGSRDPATSGIEFDEEARTG